MDPRHLESVKNIYDTQVDLDKGPTNHSFHFFNKQYK